MSIKDAELREPGNANAYMDQVMEQLREEMLIEGLDNIALPEGNLGFK